MFTRVGYNPRSQLRQVFGIAFPFRGRSPLYLPFSSRVAREIRGMLTCRGPLPPPLYQRQSSQCAQRKADSNGECGSRSLPDLTGHLTARTGDGHAPPLSSSGKTFNLAFILLSLPVRFPVLLQLNRKLHPLWCSPANSFKFQPCDRTPQAAGLTVSLRH